MNKGQVILLSFVILILWSVSISFVLFLRVNSDAAGGILTHLETLQVAVLPTIPTWKIDQETFKLASAETNSKRVWKLSDAKPAEINNLDWLQKGKLIVKKNSDFLASADGRITPQSNITLVSGLFDLGRGNLGNSFTRTFDHYIQRFSTFLKYDFPKIIFVQPEHYHLYTKYIQESTQPIYIINKTLDDIRAFPYFDKIQAIRTDTAWSNQEGWLSESPQATLELYNPMVMSKILWASEAADINPFNTEGFLWLDGGHLCNDPGNIKPSNADIFKKHMDKVLITYFDYEPSQEVHGFKQKEFREYCNSRERFIRVGRGGVFGGTKEYLQVTSQVYLTILEDTLSHHLMGTEENIFSILHYRFPELIHDYENGEGGNCAIFYESVHRQPPVHIRPPVMTLAPDDEAMDLRGLRCEGRNENIVCYDGKIKCPSIVTPMFLHIAESQWSCQGKNAPERYCSVNCLSDGQVKWYSHACPTYDICPPHGTVSWKSFYDINPLIIVDPSPSPLPPPPPAPVAAPTTPTAGSVASDYVVQSPVFIPAFEQRVATREEIEFTNQMKASLSDSQRAILERYGFNLQGLYCEILDGHEQCFTQHLSGNRDNCPSWVNSTYLSTAPDQWSCQPQNYETNYCTAVCQEGTNKVAWHAFDAIWCLSNTEVCQPRPISIPFDEFVLHTWSDLPAVPKPCASIPLSLLPSKLPITVGILARGNELETLNITMATYVEHQLFEHVNEVIFMINEKSDEMLDYIEQYTYPPYNAKILSDVENVGILNGINYLITNATNEMFLFLEKDFRLVEPLSCTLEQIQTGIELINDDKAHVVKYRSRYNPGKPNWADSMYRGHEDDVFKRQPNLLCNFYHWIEHPEKRWPDKFFVCNEDPLFYCVDSEFCNWTNNPFLITKTWWMENYYHVFPEIANPPLDFGLEGFMNWDKRAWNHRKWTVASGDGLFKHCDTNNFGQ